MSVAESGDRREHKCDISLLNYVIHFDILLLRLSIITIQVVFIRRVYYKVRPTVISISVGPYTISCGTNVLFSYAIFILSTLKT